MSDVAAPTVVTFLEILGDVPLELTVELGRATLRLDEVAARLAPGALLTLAKLTGEPLDIRLNDRLVARAEAVAIGDRYGVRILEVLGVVGAERAGGGVR